MIAAHEAGTAPHFELYGLSLNHKHIPEIMKHTGLTQKPIFVPSVGAFPQGMLVCVPLQLSALPNAPSVAAVNDAFASYYNGAGTVIYHGNANETAYNTQRLSIDPSEGSDQMEIWTFANPDDHQAVLVARLDNLGKGAAGAAVQNLKLMLDLT